MTPPRTVHLMRHGAPEGAGRMIGHSDPPATSASIAACVAAAAGLAPVAIVTSDLRRARACAEAIALTYPSLQGEVAGRRPDGGVSRPEKRNSLTTGDTPPPCCAWSPSPCRGGIDDRPALPTGSVTQRSDAGSSPAPTIDPRWRELDFGAWDGRHPRDLDAEALARFWADPEAAPPPGGERWSALVARVEAAIPALADGTLVVTHAGAIRAALAVLCGFDARQVWAVALPYAAVVTLHIWAGEPPAAQIVRLA